MHSGKPICQTAPRRDFSRRVFLLGVAAVILVKIIFTSFQMGYIWVGGAPLDDELMFRAANAVSSGQWLGSYDYLTLSKSMFFPVWLAFLHLLHLNFLIGGQLLWCGAALLAAQAFAPVLPAAARNKLKLTLFALLAFLPSSSASYTLRVYRDNIFPALCLYCFAGFAGCALRAIQKGKIRLWPWLLAAGAGLAAGYLSREDAGLFLLPFALVGTVVIGVVLVTRRQLLKIVQLVLPYLVLTAGIITFCTLNAQYYGVFALSDFSTGSFADAMGAMSRVESEAGFTRYVTVPTDVRQKLYEAVPELQPLAHWLEEDAQLQNDFRDPDLKDYRAGSFYWAIRRAAQFEGVYSSAQNAESYWADIADKINALCDDGTLPSQGGRRSGTTPPIRADYIPLVLGESAKGAVWALTFQDCAPSESLRSIGTETDFATWQSYLHCKFNGAAEAGKDTPYYSPFQKIAFGILEGGRLLYSVLLPLCFLYAMYIQFKFVRVALRGGAAARVVWLLLFGLLGMAALRCAMIAFVEVSSFGIGTSTMYLATVHPLLLLYAAVGALTGWIYKTDGPGKELQDV